MAGTDHTCVPENGVLFCEGETLDDRIPSFDGAPLDIDVTLPAGYDAGDGRLPTLVMLHGYGNDKTDFEDDSPAGDDPDSAKTFHYNNNFYARAGLRGRQLHRARLRPIVRGRRRTRSRVRTARHRSRATSTWPTSAARPGTRSTCSACSSTRGSPIRTRSGSPGSRTAAARASSSPTCAIGSGRGWRIQALAKSRRAEARDRERHTRAGPGRTWSPRWSRTGASSTRGSRASGRAAAHWASSRRPTSTVSSLSASRTGPTASSRHTRPAPTTPPA